MALLLLESSTSICSAALSEGTDIVESRCSERGDQHAAVLPVFANELVERARHDGLTIEGVAVSEGPGSYTGLRIGVSLAKGLAYVDSLPLIGVPTLQVIANGAMKHINDITADSWLCPMIDARRMEVYTALYNTQLQEMRAASAVVVDEHSFDDIIAEHDIYFVGEGAAKCKDVICGERVHFEYLKSPLAEDMLEIALQMLREGKVADIAAFEPFYLKDFVAAPSHIKGLL